MKHKSLMDKAIEIRNENQKKEELYNTMNIDKEKNNIVFEKKNNTIIKLLSFFLDLITRIFKLLFYIAIFILITIGATVILNTQTRNEFLELVNTFF